MAGSARRLGMDVEDPHVEERLRLMELELAQRSLANVEGSGSAQRRARSIPTPVSGISLATEVVGGVGINWSPSELPDLRRYEIEVSASASFNNSTTFTTKETQFIYTAGVPGLPYFFRVRQVNSRGDESSWSASLNSMTGQASYDNLINGAASNIIISSQIAGFNPARVSTAGTTRGVYLPTRIDMPTTAEVALFAKVRADFRQFFVDVLTINLRVDGDIKDTYTVRLDSIGGTATRVDGDLTFPSLNIPVLLGAGFHLIDFEVELTGSAGSRFDPVEFKLYTWEQRN